MVLDGQSIVDKRLVTFSEELVNTDDQIQPNGVDLRLDKVYLPSGQVSVPRDGKVLASVGVNEITLKDGKFTLLPGLSYWCDFLEYVDVADGFCAHLYTRSSLVRAGVDVESGLWDTGFTGRLGCTIRVHSRVEIEWGAKICQIIFFKARFNGARYEGRYQGTSQTELANEH